MKEWLVIFGFYIATLVGFILWCFIMFAPFILAIRTDSQWLGVLSIIWMIGWVAAMLASFNLLMGEG